MEDIVYHGSPLDNLKSIEPRLGTHNKEFVYATPSRIVALLFMGKGNGDLDTMIATIDGELTLVERRGGVFDKLYNKSGFLYTLEGKNFHHYDFLWRLEVVSSIEAKVLKKEVIDNIMDKIKEEELKGNIKVYHYPNRPLNVPLDNSDLIDKYINFELSGKGGSISYLLEIYPEFINQVKERLAEKEINYEDIIGS